MQGDFSNETLDALVCVFGPAITNVGFMFVREDAFSAIGWVVAGCDSNGIGGVTRCNKGEMLAAGCSGAKVTEIVDHLETALVRPVYDENALYLDGCFYFIMIARGNEQVRFMVA